MTIHPFITPGVCLVLLFSLLPIGVAVAQEPHTCGGQEAMIVGTEGDDVLRATPERHVVVGLGGNDVIYGSTDRWDYLCGGDGNDRLLGGEGKQDVLYGGEGADLLDGGPGGDHLHGEAGNDRLVGRADDATVEGGAGDDIYEGQAHFVTSPGPVEVDLAAGVATGDGTDTLIEVTEVRGSLFDDVLTGDDHSNRLRGAEGADLIEGNGGDDGLTGGVGADRQLGGEGDDSFSETHDSGDDVVDGGAGTDLIVVRGTYVTGVGWPPVHIDLAHGTATGSGTDSLTSIESALASGSENTIIGTDGPNELYASGGGNDVLHGHGGDDLLTFDGSGDDVVDGGTGDDRIVPGSCCGTSAIEGGEGTDLITFGRWWNAQGGVIVDLFHGTYGPMPNATVGDGRIVGIENVIGSPHADIIRGDAGPNELSARGGDDKVAGRAGADVLVGNKGRDRASGGPGRDSCRAELERSCES